MKTIQRKKRKRITKNLHFPEAGVSNEKGQKVNIVSFAGQEAK